LIAYISTTDRDIDKQKTVFTTTIDSTSNEKNWWIWVHKQQSSVVPFWTTQV